MNDSNPISKFAKTISSEQLGLIFHKPTTESKPTHCFENVMRFVEKNGGEIIYGWYFLNRMNPYYGEYLIATHHAVWYNPKGSLDDITPFHSDSKHHPIIQNGEIVFLMDCKAKPIQYGSIIIPLPLKFYAPNDDPKINSYVISLQKKEFDFYWKEYRIKF